MEESLVKHKDRVFYLDFLRAIATITVIFAHVEIENTKTLITAVYGTAKGMSVTWSVPIFLMITGSLFLNSDSCTFERIWKHVKKTILLIVFWGLVYNFISLFLIEGFSFSIVLKSLKMIILADTTYCYQLWYLYALIPMYFLLPVFHAFVKNTSNRDFSIIIMLFFVFTIVIPSIVSYTGDFGGESLLTKFSLFTSLFFYMLLGAFLSRVEVKRSVAYILLAVSVLVFSATIVCGVFEINIIPENIYKFDFIYVCILSSMVFIFAKTKKSYSNITQKVFGLISKYSLGIYVVHVIILQMMRKLIHFDSTFAPPYISVPVIALVTFAISLIGTFIAKKIPFVKELL